MRGAHEAGRYAHSRPQSRKGEKGLSQEVAYASLPDAQRRGLHARVLHAIERVYASRLDDRVADLAHHALEGRQWDKAVGYLERAGQRAFARSANTEAAACFEHALEALAHLPESREHHELAIDLRFELRNALTPLGQAHRTLEHLREAEKLAARLGDERRLGRALSFAANCLCLVADYEGAIEAAQRAREHAKALGDFPLGVAAGMSLGRAHAGLGAYRRAADVLGEVATSLSGERTRDYLGLPVLPAVFARSHLVMALAELGEFGAAERHLSEAIEIAEATRHPDTLLWAHTSSGAMYLVRGQVEPATVALERALNLCRIADMPVYVPLEIAALGQVGLTSPVPLIRLIAAQSRCFNVVDRGQALDRMIQERQLGDMLQQGSNIGAGQIVASDYLITPNVVLSQSDAGGAASALRGLGFVPYVGFALAIAGDVVGSLRFSEAQAVMMVTDTRSGVQIAVAEGRARATDLGGGFGLGSISGFGSLGGYSNTDQGKVVAGAFLDAFNKLVEQIRAQPAR